MNKPRFLQIHTLHSYTAALLNRDDSGLAKRLTYGGAVRTRISSQCLKRHWRMAEKDPHALATLAGFVESYRSRELVTRKVIEPLKGKYPGDVLNALEQWFQFAIYSGKAADKPKKRGQPAKSDDKKNRPTLLFGEPELKWLSSEIERLAKEADGNADKAFDLGEIWTGLKKKGKSQFQENIAIMRKNADIHGGVYCGIPAALFGRMVTSDPEANIDAPVHVAHAFTVHAEEAEGDYFTAVDDLKDENDDSGADTIQETELTCGLFYGYTVVDLPGLIKNCGGDQELAARIVHNLIYLIAEISPGAKLGSTAPYGRAEFMLLEAGDRQPRSLAGAWRKPVMADLDPAIETLAGHLGKLDEVYATGEDRACFSLGAAGLTAIDNKSLAGLAEWAAQKTGEAPDA